MFDDTLKSKVNREVGRINGDLHDLHKNGGSLKIRKARLEVEMRQAIAMRDMFELLGRLDRQPAPELRVVREPAMPEHPGGPQFVPSSTAAVAACRISGCSVGALSCHHDGPELCRQQRGQQRAPRGDGCSKASSVACTPGTPNEAECEACKYPNDYGHDFRGAPGGRRVDADPMK